MKYSRRLLVAKWQILVLKEIRHLFRDTKTIVQTVVVPTFITPLLIGAIVWYMGSVAQEESVKIYDLGYQGDNNNELYSKLSNTERFNLNLFDSEETLILAMENDEIDIGISFPNTLNQSDIATKQTEINIFSKDLDTFSQAKSLLMNNVSIYEDLILQARIDELGIEKEFLEPLVIIENDLTTDKEFAGTIIGALIAFLFIAYILQGSMYPAIDLGAGEKERGTMETLISTNISSLEIIIGKMFAITGSAVITAIFSTLGFIVPLLIVFLYFGDNLPEAFFNIVAAIVNPVAILGIFVLLIPLSIFMGALLLAISVYSKNPKEAGLLLGNVMLVFFAPAYLPLINPGLEIDLIGALIPCYSLALHTNALIAENINWMLYGVTLGSTVVYSLVAIYITYVMFDDERIIFRS